MEIERRESLYKMHVYYRFSLVDNFNRSFTHNCGTNVIYREEEERINDFIGRCSATINKELEEITDYIRSAEYITHSSRHGPIDTKNIKDIWVDYIPVYDGRI